MSYVEFRLKTAFSFQYGASTPEELCARAKELDYFALGLSDLNTLSSAPRMHRAAKKHQLKLCIGSEITPEDAPPVLLYAMNRKGYHKLSRLITLGRRRAPKGQSQLFLSDILNDPQDLLAMTPAKTMTAALSALKDGFEDRFYLLCSRHYEAHDFESIEQMKTLAKSLDLPLIANNDVHFHAPQRQDLHAIMTCLKEHKTLHEIGQDIFQNGERYLKSPQSMKELLGSLFPRALEQGIDAAKRCLFSLDEIRYEYPKEICPDNLTEAKYLRQLTWKGAELRYPKGIPDKTKGLIRHELKLIQELNYEAYFLTVYDLVRFARSERILCQGRGSAANSVVCYCLGITELDPERHEMLFERFISAERNEPPDIDVDFEHERREEVLQYLYQKYGRDRAGMTATVISYRRRSALRDVGRALGFSTPGLDRLVKAGTGFHGEDPDLKRLEEAGFEAGQESNLVSSVLTFSKELLGFPRHLSQHVGGMVITRGRLDELVPIENAAMDKRTVIEWDKDDLDDLGMLKIDVLGLGILTALHRAFLMIDSPVNKGPTLSYLAHQNPRRAVAAIVSEDPGGRGESKQSQAVYEMLCHADTVGVFQVESRAQMSMLPRLKPRCFYDLVIEVALVRPGPIQGDMVNPYLERRAGKAWAYPHPCTREVLERTLGVPLFQEQVMRLAVVAAGFTPAAADGLRRAMGAWRKRGIMDDYREKLMDGFEKKGIPKAFAQQIYKQIAGFGEYGFPESHAASFALIAYVSAWLKRFHPAALTAALINSQPMGFYSVSQLITDAKNHGVSILGVDINASDWDCLLIPKSPKPQRPKDLFHLLPEHWGLEGPSIRLGLRLIRGLGRRFGEAIEEERTNNGPFKDLEDLRERLKELPKKALTALASAGVFTNTGQSRRHALWQALRPKERTRTLPFPKKEDHPPLPTASEAENIYTDLRHLALTLRRHPLSLLRVTLGQLGARSAKVLKASPHGHRMKVAGLVVLRQRPSTANGVLFMTLEDEDGSMNLIVPPFVVEKYRRIIRQSPLIMAEGRVEKNGELVHLLVRRFEALPDSLIPFPIQSRNFR
jgi:error-prone DNA polymerase